MDAIEAAATISVGRATGYAALAIFCIVVSLSFEPAIAARAGCILCMIAAAILFHCALRAPTRPYYKTELWLILPKEYRPPKTIAQRIIGPVLCRTYRTFAEYSMISALIFLILAIIFAYLPGLHFGA